MRSWRRRVESERLRALTKAAVSPPRRRATSDMVCRRRCRDSRRSTGNAGPSHARCLPAPSRIRAVHVCRPRSRPAPNTVNTSPHNHSHAGAAGSGPAFAFVGERLWLDFVNSDASARRRRGRGLRNARGVARSRPRWSTPTVPRACGAGRSSSRPAPRPRSWTRAACARPCAPSPSTAPPTRGPRRGRDRDQPGARPQRRHAAARDAVPTARSAAPSCPAETPLPD